jgi:hypothetical protein
MPAEPLLLPLGALAFFLLDSLLMLYGNEVLLVATGRRGWRFQAGGEVLLAGRRPVLPNPLFPWQPLWRLAWRGVEPLPRAPASSSAPRSEAGRLQELRAALRPLGVLVTLLQWLMLPGLALELALFGTGGALLVLLGAIYVLVLAAGAAVLLSRRRLGLAPRAALSLAVEGLLCPPFAINLVRKVGLRSPLPDDPLELAARLCDGGVALRLRELLQRDQLAGP